MAKSIRPLPVRKVVGLWVVTLGFYELAWTHRTFAQLRDARGRGVGGWAGLGLTLVGVGRFLLPAYVGKLFEEHGREAKISGWAGLWMLLPYVGDVVWMARIQSALNDHWRLERDQRRLIRPTRTDALLELDSVSLSFGGLKVVDDLDLHVDQGEIVSVIGPNGAGKTTLFNLITGVYEPDEGDIVFAGQDITALPPHRINRLGIARTFQTLRLFLNMSVKDNVMAAAYGRTKAGVFRSMLRTPGMRREEREIHAIAEERLGFFGQRLMGYRWEQPAYSLSYANRRRLEIARATATTPRLLLLDEPAAGMNPVETHEITELIAKLREEGGYTILVIEHDMHVVEGISDRVMALDHGVKIAEGSFEEVATDPRVVEAYLGLRAAETR